MQSDMVLCRKNLISVNTSFGHLQRYRTCNNDSGFIDAVVVDGLRVKKQYLACQLSQISTKFDFWRIVEEQGVQLVIVLQQTDPNDFVSTIRRVWKT